MTGNEHQRLSTFNFTAAKCHVSSNREKWVDLLNILKAKNYDVNDWYKELQDINSNFFCLYTMIMAFVLIRQSRIIIGKEIPFVFSSHSALY